MHAEVTASKGRVLAYRIVAGLLGLLAVVFSVPFAIGSFLDDAEAIHRMHNTSGAIGFGGLIGVMLLMSAWRPMEHVAALHVMAAAALGGVLAGAISGDLISGSWYISVIVVVVVWLLHPMRRELLRFGSPNYTLYGLSLFAAIPGVALALTQAELQRNGVPAVDAHAEFHHYSAMAAAGLSIPLVGIAAAFAGHGVRFARRWVGASAIAMGVASLALSDHVGAFEAGWAWAAVGGGVLYIVFGDMRDKEAELA